jgi:HD-GYP domain-containing protein (c-di-GMP phosphodiesterase class II)
MIKCHHERYDGQGPAGLAGQDIPLGARVISVAESYDILTNDVPWRDAMTHEQAMKELQQSAGTQFDPDVLAAFERRIAGPLRKAA